MSIKGFVPAVRQRIILDGVPKILGQALPQAVIVCICSRRSSLLWCRTRSLTSERASLHLSHREGHRCGPGMWAARAARYATIEHGGRQSVCAALVSTMGQCILHTSLSSKNKVSSAQQKGLKLSNSKTSQTRRVVCMQTLQGSKVSGKSGSVRLKCRHIRQPNIILASALDSKSHTRPPRQGAV